VVTIPNQEACTVTGTLEMGSACVDREGSVRFMNKVDFVRYLEPQASISDPNSELYIPARGAAICQSREDYTKSQIALEQLCHLAGSKCIQPVVKSQTSNAP
jgi:hypothetical protein